MSALWHAHTASYNTQQTSTCWLQLDQTAVAVIGGVAPVFSSIHLPSNLQLHSYSSELKECHRELIVCTICSSHLQLSEWLLSKARCPVSPKYIQ